MSRRAIRGQPRDFRCTRCERVDCDGVECRDETWGDADVGP